MLEINNNVDIYKVDMLKMARAIKEECTMRYPTYNDCLRCDCFDAFEGECQIGDPSGWPIDEGRTK